MIKEIKSSWMLGWMNFENIKQKMKTKFRIFPRN